jgi:hypothetical protein
MNPTVEDFLRALQDVRPISPTHVSLLRAHYAAPNHTATTIDLANAMGWEGWPAVNLHYGQFVNRLRNYLHLPIEENLNTILAQPWPAKGDPHPWSLVMCPELVEALDRLCWAWAGTDPV